MIRVLLAEDMLMLRRALASLLELEPDIEVVAETGNGDRVLPLALKHRPDVAVLDIDMPGLGGIEAAARLHRELPACRTAILTNLSRPGNLRRALTAHASGFLLKDTDPTRLAVAIREVVAGGLVVDPELMLSALQAGESPLSARETEVLQLAAEGNEVPEIARALFLSAGTVRNYLTTAVSRLSARNRMDAVRIARDAGWL